jgi:chemotaxis signal transduction protein
MRAKELAEQFDRSFAEPVRLDREARPIALVIFAGGAPYLLPMADIAFVARAPKIVPLPNGSPLQLGIAGVRGSLVTVFSLTALLGQAGGKHEWLAVIGDVAIAFEKVDGQRELEGTPPNLLDAKALLP